jgi:predicted nucleotidyltransferase
MTDARAETSEFIDRAVRLLVEAASPQKIILFGSVARGEQSRDSDLDFVVILPFVSNYFSEMVRLRRALKDIRMPIDVLVYSEDDVRVRGSWPGTALHEALQTGRVLYANG